MTETKDLIIITASCGKNLELSEKFLEKSNELKISSEILDLPLLIFHYLIQEFTAKKIFQMK